MTEKFENYSYVDDLFEKRVITLDKEINEETSTELIGKILLLDSKSLKVKKPIIILIQSYGGDPHCSLGIADVIKSCLSEVMTVCIGIALSGASIILGAGHKRYALPSSRIMIHQHNWEIGFKNHTQIMIDSQESAKLFKQLTEYYSEVTGKPTRIIKKLLEKDSYLSPKEALELNLIDSIDFKLHELVK